MQLRKIHRLNAGVLLVFLAIHLITHISGIYGIDAYNAVQDFFRAVYRQPLIEPILISSITVQLAIGAILVAKMLRHNRPNDAWRWTQVISGVFFLVFMAQHLFSLGMARWYFALETDFYWPASVMSGPPFVYYFVPYYFFGVLAVVAHVGAAIRNRLKASGHAELGNRLGVGTILLGAMISASVLPILSGGLFPIVLPQEWIDYLRFYDFDFVPW